MTINGVTWAEKTQYQLEDAIQEKKRIEEEKKRIEEKQKLLDAELGIIVDFIGTLEKALLLFGEKRGYSSVDRSIDIERMRKQSTWKNILDISSANNRVLVVVDATSILVDAGIFEDRDHARNVIYSTLYSHKNEVDKLREGVYQILEPLQVIKIGQQKRKVVKVKQKKNSRTHSTVSGVVKAVKEVKEKYPDLDKKGVERYLTNNGFNYNGKNPSSSVHMAWIRLGYHKENKQQSLLGVN